MYECIVIKCDELRYIDLPAKSIETEKITHRRSRVTIQHGLSLSIPRNTFQGAVTYEIVMVGCAGASEVSTGGLRIHLQTALSTDGSSTVLLLHRTLDRYCRGRSCHYDL